MKKLLLGLFFVMGSLQIQAWNPLQPITQTVHKFSKDGITSPFDNIEPKDWNKYRMKVDDIIKNNLVWIKEGTSIVPARPEAGIEEGNNLKVRGTLDLDETKSLLDEYLNNNYKTYLMRAYEAAASGVMEEDHYIEGDIVTVMVNTVKTALNKYIRAVENNHKPIEEQIQKNLKSNQPNQSSKDFDASAEKGKDTNVLNEILTKNILDQLLADIEQHTKYMMLFTMIYNPKFRTNNPNYKALTHELNGLHESAKKLNAVIEKCINIIDATTDAIFMRHDIAEEMMKSQDKNEVHTYYENLQSCLETLRTSYKNYQNKVQKNLEQSSGETEDIITTYSQAYTSEIEKSAKTLSELIRLLQPLVRDIIYPAFYKQMEKDSSWWSKTKKTFSTAKDTAKTTGGVLSNIGSGVSKATSNLFGAISDGGSQGMDLSSKLEWAKMQANLESEQALKQQEMRTQQEQRQMSTKIKHASPKKRAALKRKKALLAAKAAQERAALAKRNETLAIMKVARETGASPADILLAKARENLYMGTLGALTDAATGLGNAAARVGEIGRKKQTLNYSDLEDDEDDEDEEDIDDEDDDDDYYEEPVKREPVKSKPVQRKPQKRSNVQPVAKHKRSQNLIPPAPPLPESLLSMEDGE